MTAFFAFSSFDYAALIKKKILWTTSCILLAIENWVDEEYCSLSDRMQTAGRNRKIEEGIWELAKGLYEN